MAGTHARLSASASERWIECPGSQRLIDLFATDGGEESEYAAEGSCAHEGAAICLREGRDAWNIIGQEVYTDSNGKKWTFTEEMSEHVQVYLDYIHDRYNLVDVDLAVETTLCDEELGSDFGGTADAIVSHLDPKTKGEKRFVHVIDFKYGVGISVPAEGNTQMMYYAFGALRKAGVSPDDDVEVGMTIIQPRDRTGDTEREHWMSARELFTWAEEEMLPAMARTRDENAPLKLGEHCRWCPVKLNCSAMGGLLKAAVNADPSSLPEMDNERLALEYELIAPAKMYIKAVEEEALKRAMAGDPVPGTHLTPGRADRVWKEGAEAEIMLKFGDDAFTEPKLRSPAQVEKACPGGKEFVAEWAFKPEARPVLKPLSAGGKSVNPNFGGGVFSNVKGG